MLPVNMFTYYIDVDEANAAGKPDWKLLHDYLEEYTMADLRPSNFRDLAERILVDEDLLMLFRSNESRQNKGAYVDEKTTTTYCGLVSSESHEKIGCKDTGKLTAYGEKEHWLTWDGKFNTNVIVDMVIGNWVKYFVDE